MADPDVRRALTPAKINLFLHVGPVDAAGYHPLESLVAFADVGDAVTLRREGRGGEARLSVEGPFASAAGALEDNLVARALAALAARVGGLPGLEVTLDKRLPVAAGLGGGSSDAGAALRLARDLAAPGLSDTQLAEIAASLGADGAMCLHARTAWASGRGERLTFEPRLPPLPAVLINPLALCPTGAVYRAYDAGPIAQANHPAPPAEWSISGVIAWLGEQRNDLEQPALSVQPRVKDAMSEAADLPGARLVRMSGSGASVFALFDDRTEAEAAARALQSRRETWWVRATVLGHV